MKRYTGGVFGKAAAFFLLVIFFAVALASAAGIAILVSRDAYQTSKEVLLKNFTEKYLASRVTGILRDYLNGVDPEDGAEVNYYYTLRDAKTGEILVSTYHGEETSFHVQVTRAWATYYRRDAGKTEVTVTFDPGDGTFRSEEEEIAAGDVERREETGEVTLWAKKDPVVQDRLYIFTHLLDLGYAMRYWAFVVLAVFGLLALACLLFLYWAAGYRPDKEEPVCGPFDRIPFDLYTFFFLLVGSAEIIVLKELRIGSWFLLYRAVLLYAVAVADFMLFTVYSISVAIRLKTHTLWKNTLLRRILALLWRGVCFVFRSVPLVWKAALGGTALAVFQLALGAISHSRAVFALLLIEVLIAAPFLFYYAVQLRRLQNAGRKIAEGDLESRLDTRGMTPHLKAHGETLNAIGEGISRAVDEKLKSERFKTELITNVSHDLKTPLTSIVNYVDLLQKCDLEDEKARGYVDVLARQSGRLKKLVVDLVEASKASSGSIKAEFAPSEANILLQQALGEYEEKFAAARLSPVLDLPEKAVTVRADPRLLWRVIENLMNNIAKYAQEGTRVYLSLEEEEEDALIIFRNVSRAPLNITGEELMERFVRGDSSRNTEGSGLGLSIAKSLAELQGGALALSVDGDLFKVTLRFPLWKSAGPEEKDKDGENG